MSGDSAKDEIDDMREALGRRVREVWIAWAKTQPEPKPSWLVPWEEMEEKDREVDRQIGETIAKEAVVGLVQENEELDQENEELHGDVARLRDQTQRDLGVIKSLHERLTRAERTPWWSWLALALSVVGLGFVIWTALHMPGPVECPPPPPPPEPVVCPPVEECEDTPTVTMTGGGYTDSDGEHHAWPDAGDYPAATFRDDCHAVCEVPSGFGRDEPGRVLLMDPAHLICVCLHRQSTWPVDRYIGWERMH